MVAATAFEHGDIMRIRWEILAVLALSAYLVWLATGKRLPIWLVGERESTVRVARVTKQSVPATVRMAGVLMPVNEAHVVSYLAGRIATLPFQVGDSVSAGAVVATLHANDIARRQNQLEAALRAARRDLTEKEQQLASAENFAALKRDLFKQDLIARRDMEQALAERQTVQAEAELARARVAQQEAMLAQALKIQSHSQITAPITGVVSRRWAAPGAVVAASSPLLSIASGNWVKFTGRITGANAILLREGLSAFVSAGESVDGIVSRVVLSGAQNEAIAEVEIQIKGAVERFRFGKAADAVITLDRAGETLRVPQSAIIESAGKHYLYKLAAGRALRQEVDLGKREGEEVVIEQGVSAGDLVIVDKLDSLTSKSRLRPAVGASGDHSPSAK